MSDIELVVKIPRSLYANLKTIKHGSIASSRIFKCVKNGTPLPKGHGRLIDADANIKGLSKMEVVDDKDKQSVRFAIIELENAPTIIDADKESGK